MSQTLLPGHVPAPAIKSPNQISDDVGDLYLKTRDGRIVLVAVNAKLSLPPDSALIGEETDLKLTASQKAAMERVYNPEIHPNLAFQLCQKHNFTLKKLAYHLGISHDTVLWWYRQHLEFKKAVQEGKSAYHLPNLEDALIKKAKGYQYSEEKVEEVRLPLNTPLGADIDLPATKKTTIKKQVEPNFRALEFALTNLGGGRWQPVAKDVNVKSHSEQITKVQTVDWAKLADSLGIDGLERLKNAMESATAIEGDSAPLLDNSK